MWFLTKLKMVTRAEPTFTEVFVSELQAQIVLSRMKIQYK